MFNLANLFKQLLDAATATVKKMDEVVRQKQK